MSPVTPKEKTLVDNRRTRHEYVLGHSFEAGIALLGCEVKSLRRGEGNLSDAFVALKSSGAWLFGLHINPYPYSHGEQPNPTRARQLLLKHAELSKLRRGTTQKGMTIVPVRIYLKGSLIKVEIALAKGKNLYDKRQALKKRDAKRDMDRGRR